MKPALSFSQRNGIESVEQLLQREFVSERVRTQVWNFFYTNTFKDRDISVYVFLGEYWRGFLCKPVDEELYYEDLIQNVRRFVFNSEWNKFFDFMEFVLSYNKTSLFSKNLTQSELREILKGKAIKEPVKNIISDTSPTYDNSLVFAFFMNEILEKENSAYRIIGGLVTDIISPIEIEEIQNALDNNPYKPCRDHLQRALELMSDRENPKYKNSIHESISAVESLAKILLKDESATLGKAIKKLDDLKKLHPCQKEAFDKLYGWVSDDGIRHGKGLKEHSELTSADARYMLIVCSAFVNYLIDAFKDNNQEETQK